MQALVIYATKFGNTEKVAQAIGRGVATSANVRVMDTVEAVAAVPTFGEAPGLLLVGGPTQRRNMSPELRAFVDALPSNLHGVPVASFDTRYRGATFLMGSAAAEATKRLRKTSGELVAPPESFFIGRGGPLESQTLELGEVERAEAWGRAVGAAVLDGGSES